jgi:hypothetical protein
MTSRNWYLARAAGLRLLVLFALAWWVVVMIVLAVKTSQSGGEATGMSPFFELLFSSPQ